MTATTASGRDALRAVGRGALAAGSGDVGRARERLRRRRLERLALVLGAVALWLWGRLLGGHPVDLLGIRPPQVDWLLVAPLVFFALLIAVLLGAHVATGRSPHVVLRPEQIGVRFADVVGIDEVKAEVARTLDLFLLHQTFAEEMGGRPRRGLLFEGPPGTGKTHTAKALATEAGVPLLLATATSFQSSFQGASQRKVRAYFRALRRAARAEGGALGFIDEFDAIALARPGAVRAGAGVLGCRPPHVPGCSALAGLPAAPVAPVVAPLDPPDVTPFVGGGDAQMTVNELLVQMQSVDQPTPAERLHAWLVGLVNAFLPAARRLPAPAPTAANVLLVASTNRADALDPALLRPGRFDQRLTFDLPTKPGRRALVDHVLARKAHDGELDDPQRRDALAAVTPGYTPAMIEGLLDEALVVALGDGRTAMSWRDVEQARMLLEVGLAQPVAYTEHERRLIATHEAGHAVVAWLVAPHRRLEVLTIVKRRSALGLLAHGDREDVYTRSRAEMTALLQIALAGQAVEEAFFGDVSTGAGGDLQYATTLAAQMVGACGMSGSLVSLAAAPGSPGESLVGRVLADTTARAAVEALLQEQRAVVAGLVARHTHLVEALRDALLARAELVGAEITDVLEAARLP